MKCPLCSKKLALKNQALREDLFVSIEYDGADSEVYEYGVGRFVCEGEHAVYIGLSSLYTAKIVLLRDSDKRARIDPVLTVAAFHSESELEEYILALPKKETEKLFVDFEEQAIEFYGSDEYKKIKTGCKLAIVIVAPENERE